MRAHPYRSGTLIVFVLVIIAIVVLFKLRNKKAEKE